MSHPLISKLKTENPLVLNLTNYVSMDFVANGLLSLGASPIMSESIDELEELLKISQALVINLGTLDAPFIQRVEIACAYANAFNVPVILDPVGAGATAYRTQSASNLLKNYKIALVRGNASEIMALAGEAIQTKGVDSLAESLDAERAAKVLSNQYECVITVSGATDVIVSNPQITHLTEGSPMMPRVVGTGCLLTAVTAAFCAIAPDDLYQAAQTAAWYYGKCGAVAAEKATGPGTFKAHFLDALDTLAIEVTHDSK
ncbi:MAG: hydroxyethylthiazole kinase [Legionellaceae bacterium]|nr:hydroxyethylthiazole kinase [Legionellaceae bacterium]